MKSRYNSINFTSWLVLVVMLVGLFTACGYDQAAIAGESQNTNLNISVNDPTASMLPLEKPIEFVSFANPEIGWGISNGDIVFTDDGGRSWSVQVRSSSQPSVIRDIDIREAAEKVIALSSTEALTVTFDEILHTMDRGRTWNRTRLEDVVIRDFVVTDSGRIWLIGEKRLSTPSEGWSVSLFTSEDRGDSWREQKISGPDFLGWTPWRVWAADSGNIWVVGYEVLRSNDFGKTWVTISLCKGIVGVPAAIGFFDDFSGFIGTNERDSFCVTSNGGNSWKTRKLPYMLGGVNGIIQTGKAQLWAYGGAGVYGSNDQGLTWQKVLEGGFLSANYLREYKKLILVGDRIVITNLANYIHSHE
mgnify:FL=1